VDELYGKIERLLSEKKRVIIGIDGMCGSGKTTFSRFLKERYNATLIQMDYFFLPISEKTKKRMDEPGGNVDYVRVMNEIFLQLDQDEITYNKYDDTNLKYTPETTKLSNLVVIEGAYSMRPEFIKFYDLKLFFSIESELQIKRLTKREGIDGVGDYIDMWIPLENKYIKELGIRKVCDHIVEAKDGL